MHACQSAIAHSFPIQNPCDVMHETTYVVYNNMLKGILHAQSRAVRSGAAGAARARHASIMPE